MHPAPAAKTTDFTEIDTTVARVRANADRWVAVSIADRVRYLERCMDALHATSEGWAAATSTVRGIDPNAPGAAEAWLSELMPTMRAFRLLAGALRHGGQPTPPSVKTRAGDQKVVRVYPTDLMDKLLFTGVTADVWLEPGRPASQGELYREKAAGRARPGKLSLVLGAGNVGSICPTDAIYKLFVEDEVVVVKTNPVNAYLTPFWEATLRPLVDDGFIAFIDGGPEAGVYLTQHPEVSSIHITGSDKTYDAIVWGGDPTEQERRKASGERVNTRHVAAELGCVTPVFIIPGEWSDKEMAYQARAVALMVTNNASFNCTAGKVLVTWSRWPQREQFMGALKHALAEAPVRKAYYPGSAQRYDAFMKAYPNAEVVGRRAEGAIPWTLVPNVPVEGDEYAFTHEAWCGVLADTPLEANNPSEFMQRATQLANEKLWGTLSCNLIVDPRARKVNAAAFDAMVADLQYGGIGINIWAGAIFGLASPPWGAFPGHTPEDIQSGTGFVHNTFLLDHPQKTVLEAPFTIFPPPAWFDGHRGALEVGRRIVKMEYQRSWLALPGLVRHALRS